MYGIIYMGIKDFAEKRFGTETWESILTQSGVTANFTISEQPYNDDVTYQLAKTAADVTGESINSLLFGIGKQVMYTTKEKFTSLMSSRGETLLEYLLNLPNFHNRISLIYPELTPPEFRISDIKEGSVVMHYRNKRPDMQQYVLGYFVALGEIFKENIVVEPISDTPKEETYKIIWQ